MSDDFIRGLQNDLVEAMERYERRSPRRRLAAALSPGLLRPSTLVRVAAVVAILVAAVVAVRKLVPEPPPARPHVVAVLRIGGTPIDAAVANGSLWATDYTGSVVRIDPDHWRVMGRIKVPGSPSPITSDPGGLWVQTGGKYCEGSVLRIDPGSGRIVVRISLPYPSEQLGALAGAGGGGVWVKRGFCSFRQELERLDRTGALTARVALGKVDGLASAAGTLWVLGHDGTLTQVDSASGRVRQRWRGLAPLGDPNTWNTKALVADDAGVWALSSGRATVFRIERGRIVRRLAIGVPTLPLLTQARDGLWTATAARLGGDYRLLRLDPDSGRPTAVLKLGAEQPVALTAANGRLCVVTGDGKLVVIGS